MNTIADQWATFDRLILRSASDVQRREMRRAFYAGIHSALIFMRDTVGADDVSEDAGMALIQNWHDECLRFAQSIGNGDA